MRRSPDKNLGTATDPIPDELLDWLEAGQCVLLTGAGISRRSLTRARTPLPSWGGLLSAMVRWAYTGGFLSAAQKSDLTGLVSAADNIDAAQELLEAMGRDGLHEFLDEVFDPTGMVPSILHELLVSCPFAGFVTTNFDNLLERAHVTVHQRQMSVHYPDELEALAEGQMGSATVVKLHGDLDRPDSLILGRKHYQNASCDPGFTHFLDRLFSDQCVVMVGYGLQDPDVLAAIDRVSVTQPSAPTHYMLRVRGSLNDAQKKRLLADRGVKVIEYIDYFGFHNHVDTFVRGLNYALGRDSILGQIRSPLQCRIHIHYPSRMSEDGNFVWNYVFREGAITLGEEAQADQLQRLQSSILEGFKAIDYLLFVLGPAELAEGSEFFQAIQQSRPLAATAGVQVILLVVGAERRPSVLSSGFPEPCFYLNHGFSEKDLTPVREYIAQDLAMGCRQP